MSRSAVQLRVVAAPPAVEGARVIDMRTGKNWRRPEPSVLPFLLDMAITAVTVSLGAWLFLKMQGG